MNKIKLFILILNVGLISHAHSSSEEYYSKIDPAAGRLGPQLHELVKKQRYISYKEIWGFLDEAHQIDSQSVLLYYTQRTTPKTAKASGANQAQNDYWNREHVWPQSKGLKGTDARRELHNIVPADRSVNSSRGNKYFDNGGSRHKECSQCLSDGDSWEPPNQVKGDIARIIFYMDLRYDGNDYAGTPDLVVTDGIPNEKRYFSGLSTLITWHCQDAVDNRERRINEVVFRYQGNRNPFVDHPEWTQTVFGFDCQ